MILGTPHMTSTKASEDLNVILRNTALERVKLTKFLGVLIDECLIWKKPLTAYKQLYQEILLSCILHALNCTLISPYPRARYGILIWEILVNSILINLSNFKGGQ